MAYCIKGNGVLNVIINGRTVRLEAESDVMIYASDEIREAQVGGEYVIKERSPGFSGTFHVPKDMRVSEIQELACSKVIVELYDGRVFVFTNASQIGQNEFNARAGTIDLEFIAEAVEERLPA